MTGLDSMQEMVEEILAAPEVVRPSSFWNAINDMNTRQLAGGGFENFKRTVNSNYFQWLPTGLEDPQFRAVLLDWMRSPTVEVASARLVDKDAHVETRFGNPLRTLRRRIAYAIYVALLWEAVRKRVPGDLLEHLDEPLVGNPLLVEHRGRRITQDLCNSVLEYATVTGASSAPADSRVIELGAGYGRLAWVFLSQMRKVQYVIVDIPPALAVSEEYLSQVLPDRQMFAFRRFARFDDVADEFFSAQLAFVTPNQVDLIPPLNADLFITVSSLHEMKMEQIKHYFDLVDTHCSGFFYTKQWSRWRNPVDDVVVSRKDYPIRRSWKTIFERRHPIQRRFFEALYDVGASG